ncbi:MAG TPA: hypothetical protein PKX28_08820 [Candidatus Hydrogenedentes bacterium]|nr:hypothetical protein [Candidatus Hydrogenedentota bacterium]HOJ67979.1 hypothetical protein [Candidatus Hydrogenedentota bacterium]HOK89960.1 hypothetical protein [Candidatus Hydrogenedentota bacterium]HOV60835.1 hypothetical protein [Candidatus Hydrogenedentota bacterium]HPO31333.1 hypothetical protein [Candidatus Hydrogenedentota bacterium]
MLSKPVEGLKPGEIVAEPVRNAAGAVLCPEGFVLTEQAIARLRNAGVTTVRVRQDLDNNAEIDARLARLDARFEGVTDPALARLRRIVGAVLNGMRN